MYYDTLNDASDRIGEEALAEGSTEIWYAHPDVARDLHIATMVEEEGEDLIPETYEDLSDTHVHLGSVAETDLETIFRLMQGLFWSPQGEARALIEKKGLIHTSMNVGDVIVVDGVMHMVESMGFSRLGE